jgi:hypothetical protein
MFYLAGMGAYAGVLAETEAANFKGFSLKPSLVSA